MTDDLIVQNDGIYEAALTAGMRMAEKSVDEGGWAEYFDPDQGLEIKDPILKAQTAIVMENNKRWQAQLCRGKLDEQGRMVVNEATRSALLGGFSDYIFPIIRAGFPTNPINDLVSVQPTTRRTATVVYWNWIYGSNKGTYYKGQRMFDANRGTPATSQHYSDNVVEGETTTIVLSNDGGTGDVATGTLAYHDGGGVVPGTVKIVATCTISAADNICTFYDDGVGGFTALRADGSTAITLDSGTINYTTGVFVLNVPHASVVFKSGTTTATTTYRWDSEGSGSLPEVDVQITTSTTETQRRAMKLNYSAEAMQDVMAEFGVSLEPQLISGAAEQMNFETARQLISQMWGVASLVDSFAILGSTQYTQQDHFRDLIYVLNKSSNTIWKNTQKGYGNWLVVDEGAANIIESLPPPLFEAAPRPASVHGLHFIGTLAGKYRVYKDIFLVNETGASSYGNILMGYKGSQFFEAGLVYAPYQVLYTTETLQTADFLNQKGMASRYATKMINANFYVRISITASV